MRARSLNKALIGMWAVLGLGSCGSASSCPEGTEIQEVLGPEGREARCVLSTPPETGLIVRKRRDGQVDRHSRDHADALMAAASDGPVRVIVKLDVDVQREALLSPAQVDAQRGRVAAEKDRLLERMENTDATPLRMLDPLPYLALGVDEASMLDLLENPAIRLIQQDVGVPPALEESIPVVGADTLWDTGHSAQGQVVAVLDTGIEQSHPFFQDIIVDEACFSQNWDPDAATSLCDNGEDTDFGQGAAPDCDGIPGCGHGTHVAGIAAGVPTAELPTGGVGRDAEIVAIQVFHRRDDDDKCSGDAPCVRAYWSDIAAALLHVGDLVTDPSAPLPVAAANMSLGGGSYDEPCDDSASAIADAVAALYDQDVASIAASGNGGEADSMSAPACISQVVSVGNATKQDEVVSSSNSASFLDLMAPGAGIASAIPGGDYGTKSGTSMAAPHAAGSWAMLKAATPGASVADVLNALADTGVPVEDDRVSPPRVVPRIDVYEAYWELGATAHPPEPDLGPGIYETPHQVTLTSPTADANLRYTLDGTQPTATEGTLLTNGGTVEIQEDLVLKAVAFTDDLDPSQVVELPYEVRASLQVDLEPADAVADGARWRLADSVAAPLESGALDRFEWDTMGHGDWAAVTRDSAYAGSHKLESPPLDHNELASVALTVESDGGTISFDLRVSSEPQYDELCFFIDDVEQDCWSGEVGWTEASYFVGPGTRTLRWTYEKDFTVSMGEDTAWVANIVLPGDQWRSSGETVSWLSLGEHPIVFRDIDDWVAPSGQSPVVKVPSTAASATYGETGTVPEPQLDPPGGTYTEPQSVTLSHTMDEAQIRYTLDGTEPTASSTLYDDPIQLEEQTTTHLRARAFREGWDPSPMVEATYEITGTVPQPQADPAGGAYQTAQEVVLTSTMEEALIRYTLDGSTPTEAAPAYTEPISIPIDSEVTLRARGFRTDWAPSPVLTESYDITGTVPAPEMDPPGGVFDAPPTVSLSVAMDDATIRHTTDGTTVTESSPVYEEPLEMPPEGTVTIRARAYRDGWSPSSEANETYEISLPDQVAPPELDPPQGAYDAPQQVTLTSPTIGASLRYTTDGSTPTEDHGTLIAQGDSVLVDEDTHLRVVAFTHGASALNEGHYLIRSSLVVELDPPQVVDEGAQWRLVGPVDAPLESGALDRFDWQTSGDGDWTLEPLDPDLAGSFMAQSPPLDDDEHASVSVAIESDGGEVDFSLRVSSEEHYDELCFAIDDDVQDCWSGEVGWTTASFEVEPGARLLTWTYAKDFLASEGADTAWIADIVLPGDSWRESGAAATWLPEGSHEVVFRDVSGWATPPNDALQVQGGTITEQTASYVSTGGVPDPDVHPPGGSFTDPPAIELSSTMEDVVLHYTLDDELPTQESPVYQAPIQLQEDTEVTLRVRGYRQDWAPSAVVSETYEITGTVPTPQASPEGGTYTQAQEVILTSPMPQATIRYTLDGTEPTEDDPHYFEPLEIEDGGQVTLTARSFRPDWAPSEIMSATYDITGTVPPPEMDPEGGVFQGVQKVALSTPLEEATIRYTLDGTEPHEDAPVYKDPVELEPGGETVIRARAYQDGWEPSPVTSATYAVVSKRDDEGSGCGCATPPAGGTGWLWLVGALAAWRRTRG